MITITLKPLHYDETYSGTGENYLSAIADFFTNLERDTGPGDCDSNAVSEMTKVLAEALGEMTDGIYLAVKHYHDMDQDNSFSIEITEAICLPDANG